MTRDTQAISTDQTLQLLSDYRRRKVLHTLRERDGEAVSLAELAAEIAKADTTSSGGACSSTVRTKTTLCHNHLPKLAENEVITWDQQAGVVTDGPAFDTVEPVLRLLQHHDTELPTGYLSEEPGY